MYEIRTVIVELERPIDSDDDYLVNGISDEHYGVARELVRCKDCIHYDKPHVENNGTRIEYDDLPEEAFENCIGRLVNSSYGINVGGRCCRDYNVGYSEDKRVFVPETNYCGRAERKTE